MAIYQNDPWGDDWAQAATIATACLSPWTKKKINPADFIPGRRQSRRQSRDEVAQRLKLFFDNQDQKNTS